MQTLVGGPFAADFAAEEAAIDLDAKLDSVQPDVAEQGASLVAHTNAVGNFKEKHIFGARHC